jgi:hypothetical protein
MSEPEDPVSVERAWIWYEGREPRVGFTKPPESFPHQTREFMRVLTKQQLTKLAETQGVELDAYATTLYRICESQRRHIAHLQERIARLHELVHT